MLLKGQLKGEYIDCEWCGKPVYKTPSQLSKHEHHYCSNKCQSEKKHYDTYEDRPCEICGELMHVSKKSTQRFCSQECQNTWQTQQVGELNKRFSREKISCDYCGNEFFIKKYKTNMEQKHFCSNKCRQEWYANVWSQSDNWKEESRKRAVDIIKNNTMTTLTKPQIIVNELLETNNIKYNNEEPFVYYSIDNYLVDYNLIIEVMGDYWHGNPLKFNQLNDLQRKNIGRDKAKHTFIQKYYGINILYLWEKDILERPDLCTLLIKSYVENNGILENYHSFNYILYNEKLTLSNQLMQSYQDMENDEVKEHIKVAV